jgi:hypothetical protein
VVLFQIARGEEDSLAALRVTTLEVDVRQPGATRAAVARLAGEVVAVAVVVALLAGAAVVAVPVAEHPVGVETAVAQLMAAATDHEQPTVEMDRGQPMAVAAEQPHMEEPLHTVAAHHMAAQMMAPAPHTEASTQTLETAHPDGEARQAPQLPRPVFPHQHLARTMRPHPVRMRLPRLVLMARILRLRLVVRWTLPLLGYTLLLHQLLRRPQGLGRQRRLRPVVKIQVIIEEGLVCV